MKVLTYTLYKEHCDVYTEIHGSIAVNSSQIELAQKDIILLSNAFTIVYKTGKRTAWKTINLYTLTSQRALIQFTILM